ncbi:MAG: division/cell wall cluster transcriptional repressor MraZ, partial [Candidatus Omnitrophica bacterium]|nr:division/cell wall cluster transcriptional repressor MraZ [Candidatus Omnitrophota bacterium]
MKEHYIEKFYVTRGLDKCLFMFSEEEWKVQETKFKALPFTKPDARKFNRFFFSGATDVAPDKQGRILLPKFLKDYAGIKKDVIVIGISNRIEIWSEDKWREFYKAHADSFEDIAEKLIEE